MGGTGVMTRFDAYSRMVTENFCEAIADVKMTPVSSSAIEAVGYDPSTGLMRIRFTGGNEYDFCDVPENVYQALMSASSRGTYYNDYIRDRYPC
jgi:hypothetical protein